MSCDVEIIEDEEAVCFALEVILASKGITTSFAYTGNEGLDLARKTHPALVLVDVRLPDMDGWEVCRQLKTGLGGHPPLVMFVTAATQEQDRRKAEEAGGDAFIAKPFEMDHLVAEIKRLLGRECGSSA